MTNNIAIRRATVNDRATIAQMLEESGADPEGLEQWIENYLVAEMPDETVFTHRIPNYICPHGICSCGST
ncbi:hypothetical protein [Effusibacillus dendaii]|uniref:Uncharacterized protein n=1 Tax=Effusibacillus dendaii TaxID=2743772 RepID=A0A7I8DBW4_9BACL|nr:hypothetical protein [Effusibacillus dendaii]BCJ87663.1 hypothetical protein skT53_26480 [Effusibacillus dendaii]